MTAWLRIPALAVAAGALAVAIASGAPAPTFTAPGVPFPGQQITLRGANWTFGARCSTVEIRRLGARPVVARGLVTANRRFVTRWRLPPSARGEIKLVARQACGRTVTTKRLSIFVSGN